MIWFFNDQYIQLDLKERFGVNQSMSLLFQVSDPCQLEKECKNVFDIERITKWPPILTELGIMKIAD